MSSEQLDARHQIAYAFEKAARLKANQKPDKVVEAANKDILKMLSSQSWVIKADPMLLFYCIYFCVFYKNEDVLGPMRELALGLIA